MSEGGLLPPLILELRAKAGEFQSEMKKSQAEIGKTAKSAEDGGSRVGNAWNKAAGAGKIISFAAVGAGIAVAAYALKASDAADVSDANLSAALKNAGTSFDAQRSKIAATDAQMTRFGFTNAETNQSLAQLTVGLHDPAKAMGAMTTAANLARLKHMDLASASVLVMKAMEGQTRPLKALGIDLPIAAGGAKAVAQAQLQLSTATEKAKTFLDAHADAVNKDSKYHLTYMQMLDKTHLAQQNLSNAQTAGATVLKTLNQRLGGVATAYGDTLPGKIAVAHAQFTNMSATLGQKLTPILLDVAGKAAGLATAIMKNKPALIVVAGIIGTVMVGAITAYVSSLVVAGVKSLQEFGKMAANAAQWAVENAASFAQAIAAGAVWVAQTTAQIAEWVIQHTIQLAAQTAGTAVMVAGYVATAAAATAAFIAENAASLGIVAAIGLIVVAVIYVAKHWKQIWGDITAVFHDVVGFIKSHVDLLLLALGPIGITILLVKKYWRDVWDDVQTAISVAVDVVKAYIGILTTIASGFINLLVQAGKDIINGLVNGIKAMANAPIDAIKAIAGGILSAAKKALHIFSPSLAFHELGLFITQGWANGIAAGTPAVISQVKSAAASVLAQAKSTLSSLQSQSKQLASSTTSSYLQAADVTGATGTGLNGTLTTQDVLGNLANQAAALEKYRGQLAALRKEGLNASLYKQLVAAGVSGGSGTATALLAGGSAAIKQADTYSASITSSATSLGQNVAAAEYGKAIAKALKAELKDAQLVASVDVYLDGQKLQANMVKHSQRRAARNGTTGLAAPGK